MCLLQSFLTIFIEIKGKEDFYNKSNKSDWDYPFGNHRLGRDFCRHFWHRNIHWYDKYEKALKEADAKEKQVTLPSGHVINYGEVENDKPALLLIHGQMGMLEDYALVMPQLSKDWHIYAIDVYGHGNLPMRRACTIWIQTATTLSGLSII